jgi:hypothetical protein
MNFHLVLYSSAILFFAAGCGVNSSSKANAISMMAFTNRDKYYQIQVPDSWKYEQPSGDHYYLDIFKSPDGNAAIENLAYDDGTPIGASSKADFALGLLDQYFVGGDRQNAISISDTSMMNDGSERLAWASASGGDSGISFLEVRNQTTLLVFTVEWMNGYKSQYFDLLDRVVASYTVP